MKIKTKRLATALITGAIVLASAATFTGCMPMPAQWTRDPSEHAIPAERGLQYLKDGHERYLAGTGGTHNFDADREILGEEQNPFAIVLGCSDSRVNPELLFDMKRGDIFTTMNAGNFADDTSVGSMQFAIEVLGARLIVVMGHTGCGAVISSMETADLSGLRDGFLENGSNELQGILGQLAPIVAGTTDVMVATRANVEASVARLAELEVVHYHDVMVVGAIYDVGSGEITWFEN
ncbi:MAG: hypothetical protein FWF76_03560 [Oscillospiraceae bacterium]|nr:hypothetical protein [Oscillospiraceae bacterium]